MIRLKKLYLLILLFPAGLQLFAFPQEKEKSLIQWHIPGDTATTFGIQIISQVWTRYIENNPDKNGVEQYPDFDLGLRRTRIILTSSLKDKFFVLVQAGADGYTYRSPELPALSLFNVATEYAVIKNKIHLGFGLHSWNGFSRYTSGKPDELLTVDYPGFVRPFEGTFSRNESQPGVYLKGNTGKLMYRLSVTKPYENGIDSVSTPFTTERLNENFAFQGYFSWQFFDRESQELPWMTMNNLGRSRLLSLGAGFYYHPEAMLVKAEKDLSTVDPLLAAMLEAAGRTDLLPLYADYFPSQISDIFLASADILLDIPMGKTGAVTSSLSYNQYFFGPDYLRSGSVMNVSRMNSGDAIPQGHGNSQWESGTGQIIHGELGVLIPKHITPFRIQPYAAFTWKNFDALDQSSIQTNAGINWYPCKNHVKWTLQYSNRPVYQLNNGKNKIEGYKGQIIMQTQISF